MRLWFVDGTKYLAQFSQKNTPTHVAGSFPKGCQHDKNSSDYECG